MQNVKSEGKTNCEMCESAKFCNWFNTIGMRCGVVYNWDRDKYLYSWVFGVFRIGSLDMWQKR